MSEKDLYPRKLNLIEKFGNIVAKVLGWLYLATVIFSIVLYLPIIVFGILIPPLFALILTFLIELVQTTCEFDNIKPYHKKVGRKFVKAENAKNKIIGCNPVSMPKQCSDIAFCKR